MSDTGPGPKKADLSWATPSNKKADLSGFNIVSDNGTDPELAEPRTGSGGILKFFWNTAVGAVSKAASSFGSLYEDVAKWAYDLEGKMFNGLHPTTMGMPPGMKNPLTGYAEYAIEQGYDTHWKSLAEDTFRKIEDGLSFAPMATPEGYDKMGFLDRIQEPSFWFNEAGEGLEYGIGFLAPGKVFEGLGVGTKLVTSLGKAEKLADMSKAAQLTGKTINLLSGSFAMSAMEGSSEARNLYENLYPQLVEKYIRAGMNPQDAHELAKKNTAQAASESFTGNIGYLMVTNSFEMASMFKPFRGSGKAFRASKTVDYLTTSASESLEEILQSGIERYEKAKWIDGDYGDDNHFNFIHSTAEAAEGLMHDTDTQISGFLGAITGNVMLGGKNLLTYRGRYKVKQMYKRAMATELSKINGLFEAENGKVVVNPDKLAQVMKTVNQYKMINDVFKEGVEKNSAELIDFAHHLLAVNMAYNELEEGRDPAKIKAAYRRVLDATPVSGNLEDVTGNPIDFEEFKNLKEAYLDRALGAYKTIMPKINRLQGNQRKQAFQAFANAVFFKEKNPELANKYEKLFADLLFPRKPQTKESKDKEVKEESKVIRQQAKQDMFGRGTEEKKPEEKPPVQAADPVVVDMGAALSGKSEQKEKPAQKEEAEDPVIVDMGAALRGKQTKISPDEKTLNTIADKKERGEKLTKEEHEISEKHTEALNKIIKAREEAAEIEEKQKKEFQELFNGPPEIDPLAPVESVEQRQIDPEQYTENIDEEIEEELGQKAMVPLKKENAYNTLAYSSRKHKNKQNVDNVLNEGMVSKEILDPEVVKRGTRVTFELADDPEIITYVGDEERKWGDIRPDEKSQEYLDKVPIVVKLNGNPIAYLHNVDWVTENNIYGDIKTNIDNLREVRKHIIKNGKTESIITSRSEGALFFDMNMEAKPLTESIPSLPLAVAWRNDLVGAKLPEGAKIKEGRVYAVTENEIIPIRQDKLDKNQVSSIVNAVRNFVTHTLDSHGVWVKKNMGLDLTKAAGLNEYIRHFTHTYNVPDNAKNYDKGKYKSPLGAVAAFKNSGFKAITVEGNSVDFVVGNGIADYSISSNTPQEMRPMLYSFLSQALSNMHFHVAKELLGKNISLVTFDGTQVHHQPIRYEDYARQHLSSSVIPQNIGTEKNPKWVYRINPVITFDTSFLASDEKVPGKPKGKGSLSDIVLDVDDMPRSIDDVSSQVDKVDKKGKPCK